MDNRPAESVLANMPNRRELASLLRAYARLAQALQRMRYAELAADRQAEFVHLASRLTATAQPLAEMLRLRRRGELGAFTALA